MSKSINTHSYNLCVCDEDFKNLLPKQLLSMQPSIINYSNLAVPCIPLTHLFYTRKFVPFAYVHSFCSLPNPPVATINLFSASLCVLLLFICFLDSKYPMIPVFFCLTYSTYNHLKALRVCPCHCRLQDSITFYGWIMFHCIYKLHFLHPFIDSQILRL